METITINTALDQVLELKGKLREARKDISELNAISIELLNLKIDLGGRSFLTQEMFLKVSLVLDKSSKSI
jgi:hypothetical protein